MGAAEVLKVDQEDFKTSSADLAELYIISVQEYLKCVLPELPEFTAMCIFKD